MKICLKYLFYSLIPVILIVIISFFHLDRSFAMAVHSLFPAHEVKYNAQLGIYLTACAYFSMIPIFIVYYIFRLEGFEKSKLMQFVRQLSLSVILGYFCKDCFKFFFGRETVQHYATGSLKFMLNPHSYGFHFFTLGYDSFPSGHMTMICATMVSIILFYPKLRIPAVLMIILMIVSLLLFNFHFISDVVAGTYLGTTIAIGVYYLGVYKNETERNCN